MNWLVGVKGTAKWLAALATGDIASDDEALLRASTCAACPSRMRFAIPARAQFFGAPPMLYSCGILGEEHDAPRTCGCVTIAQCETRDATLTIDGVPMRPACKALVASARCDQGRWGAVQRIGVWATLRMVYAAMISERRVQLTAAGKACVRSERCPQGKWTDSTRP